MKFQSAGGAGPRGGFKGPRGGFEGQRGGFEGQRGGFAMGLIVGLLVGLALALGVALYVTKVPMPFLNKVPQRTAEQDAAELEKNRNWDPNSPLYGKNPVRPGNGANAAGAVGAAVSPLPAAAASAVAAKPAGSAALAQGTRPPRGSASGSARDPAADPAAASGDRVAMPVPSNGPNTPNAPSASAKPGADPFIYFVQAGAYVRAEDADQQRAKLAIQGFNAKVTEREQAGRTMYRVRVGPLESKDAADATKEKLDSAGVDSALVRVQK